MAILKVARLGYPVLRNVTEAVMASELTSRAVQQFIDDMLVNMKNYDSVGLAADQAHESKQIAVLEIGGNSTASETLRQLADLPYKRSTL
jgi:peptide deformylase